MAEVKQEFYTNKPVVNPPPEQMVGEDTTPLEAESLRLPVKRSRWRLLRNVLRAVTLFKTHDVYQAEDLTQLIHEIKAIPTDDVYRIKNHMNRENSALTVAIRDLRRQQSLLQCVERGNQEDLETMKKEIDQDPYKLLRNNNHPYALINKRNLEGQTPLYIACKYGNLDVVVFLLKENADYLLNSLVDDEEESNLEVAIRWGHQRIVTELLKLKWPKSVLSKARNLVMTEKMRSIFQASVKKKTFRFCCFKC